MGKKLTDYLKLNLFKGDKGIWMIYFLLCMVSLVSIYSASSNLTFSGGNHWGPVVDQYRFPARGTGGDPARHPHPLQVLQAAAWCCTRW